MAVVRWEPARELATLQSEMSRLMNHFWGAADAGGSQNAMAWLPALDVWETEDEIVLAVDLPGISEEAVSLEVDLRTHLTDPVGLREVMVSMREHAERLLRINADRE